MEGIKKAGLNYNQDGWRIGSLWDGHSKLVFCVDPTTGQVYAKMYENFDPKDRHSGNKDYVEAIEAGKRFKEEVIAFTS